MCLAESDGWLTLQMSAFLGYAGKPLSLHPLPLPLLRSGKRKSELKIDSPLSIVRCENMIKIRMPFSAKNGGILMNDVTKITKNQLL